MSIRAMLIHRCDLVSQGVVTGTDDYGRDIYGETVIPGVVCRADQLRMRSSSDESGVDFILENVVYFPPDVKIEEEMRVTNVVDKEGNPVLAGSFGISNINTVYGRLFLHHYEVSLRGSE